MPEDKALRLSIHQVLAIASGVAIVDAERVRTGRRRVDAKVLEALKGNWPEKVTLAVPTLWGRDEYNWFKKGERAFVITINDEFVTFGRLGRLAQVESNGQLYARSHCGDPIYISELHGIEDEDTLLYSWDELYDLFTRLLQNQPTAEQDVDLNA